MQTNLQGVSENDLNRLSSGDTLSLFSSVFNSNQFAFAFTNEGGDVILSNPSFSKIVDPTASSQNLFDLAQHIRVAGIAEDVAQDAEVHSGIQTVKLKFRRIPEQPNGARFLWTINNEVEAMNRHKLTAAKNLYQSFIDSSFEMIFRTSAEGLILFANQPFLKGLGFDQYIKIKNKPVELIFEDPAQFQHIISELKKNKRLLSETVYLRKTDGKRLTALVNCHLFHDGRGVDVYNWVALDISHQVEYENTLKFRNEELAKVNHQIEKFLYSTSHDLRSPITSILGLVNIMRMESRDAVMLDYISKIEFTTKRLDKIIRDTMSFASATYKRIASDRIDFELWIWKVINSYRGDPASRRISFAVQTEGAYPFYTDSERLEIILENIVRNAIHFYDSTKLRSFINVKVKITEENALIEVMDNGIGIGKQHHHQIFNMFYKASHLSKGTGLGLYIVKETIGKLHGTIEVESEIGFGTVIRFRIPNDHKGRLIGRKLKLTSHID